MISLNRVNGVPNTSFVELFGTSQDAKPVGNYNGVRIGNGSKFFEIDTSHIYIYDAEHNTWMPSPISGNGLIGV